MKQFQKIICAGLMATVLITGSCKKILEEHPQSSIYPSIFNTSAGLVGGVSGVYNDLRGIWGTEGFTAQGMAGTDEVLTGASASGTDFYTYNPLLSSDMNGSFWNNAYQDINTINALFEYGPKVTMDSSLKKLIVAQCKFLRAFWYYHLVISFGDVPLHLTYISKPTLSDTRAPIANVYTQIIKDLTEASTELPVTSPVSATATNPFGGKAAAQGVALYLLGKTYLTRGWSSAAQSGDFAQAATILTNLINNKTTYGFDLWQDYADAFKPGPFSVNTNDYGKESMFVSDHSSDTKYGQYTSQASGGAAQNLLPWLSKWNYPATSGINSFKNGSTITNSGTNMMTRDVANGRPFIRTRPNNPYILNVAFAERTIDSRYDKTFQTVWIANTAGVSTTATTTGNSRGIGYTLTVGVDTAVWMPPYEVTGAPQFNGAVPFKGLIIPPSLQNNTYFPAVKKFDDPFRAAANFNDPSTRPVVIWRFADVYLLAAEAYFKANDNVNAAKYLNLIRERAAWRSTNTGPQNTAAAAAMDILPGDVTLNLILEERTREFYFEGTRWWDLVRTQTLYDRVKQYNPVEAGAHIQTTNVLRPVPQEQIDRVTQGPKFPQNQGYN